MAIKAFLSSTRLDLDPDCRPAALDGIRHGGGAEVAMETWVATYGDPLTVCRDKLTLSTHYVGVFAYRYGSRIPDDSRSITEAEFACARDVKDTGSIIAFVPDPSSPFAAVLLARAHGQSPEDESRQRDFLEAIRKSGAYTLFTASHDLYQRVKTMVEQWGQGSLLETARIPVRSTPSEAAICELGRGVQVAEFEDSYAQILARPGAEVAAFAIEGLKGAGQQEMAIRLRNVVEHASRIPVVEYTASVSPAWRNDGLRALLSVLGRALRPGFSPATVDEYAAALIDRLRTTSVILTVHDVQRFANSLEGFTNSLWRPLAARLATEARNPMICLAAVERIESQSGTVRPLSALSIDAWSPGQVIGLTTLERFTKAELAFWLRRWIAKEHATRTAETLIEETGGEPRSIYTEFRDPGFWNSLEVFDVND